MLELMAAELRRYRRAALTVGAFQLLLLAALAIDGELLRVSSAGYALAALAYGAMAFFWGFHQMGSWRQGDGWLFLLHRPLTPRRILVALGSAVVALLLVSVVLPLAAVLGVLALGRDGGVDARFGLLVPLLALLVTAAYLAGCLLALRRTPAQGLVVVLLGLLLLPSPLGGWVLVPQLALVAWLGGLLLAAFVPDLDAPPRRPLPIVGTVVPVAAVLYGLLSFALLFAYSLAVAVREEGWRSFARFAWNDYFPVDSYASLSYLDSRETIARGLAASGEVTVTQLASALDEGELLTVAPTLGAFPRRHQPPTEDRGARLALEAAGVELVVRHDAMALAIHELRSGARLGWLGPEGGLAPTPTPRFPDVPRVVGDQVVTPRLLARLAPERDPARMRLLAVLSLPAGDRLTSAAATGATAALVLSERALWVLPPLEVLAGEPHDGSSRGSVEPAGERSVARPRMVVPLPAAVADLDRADVAILADGRVLASLLFGRRSERGYGPARQVIELVEGDRSRRLVDRRLDDGPPSWVPRRGYLVSPLLAAAEDLGRAATLGGGDGPRTAAELAAHPPPWPLRAVAWLLAAGSALAAWWLAGRRSRSRSERVSWTLAAGLLGPPGFLAFLLLTAGHR